IGLDLYREAEETLKKKDWAVFEKELFSRLQEEPKGRNPLLTSWQRLRTLAEILAHNKDWKRLFKTIKDNHDLLVRYEEHLLTLYPNQYLEAYRAEAEKLIAGRGRGNYMTAVEYLTKVRAIYRALQKRSDGWDRYIRELVETNKSLTALWDELRKAKLIP
ncbi:MAG: hypothetical protein ACLGPL_01850, partial [Acidobacteriota bacterium]